MSGEDRGAAAAIAAGEVGPALLALSRELAAAGDEDDVAAALARALEALFAGRAFCVRLLEAKTLAITAQRARGALRPDAAERVALRRAAVEWSGLAAASLERCGLAVTEHDEPLLEGSERALAAPLAAAGQLLGIAQLEFAAGDPAAPEAFEPLLAIVAGMGAVAARGVRSRAELAYLEAFLEHLIENANALIAVVNRRRDVIVFNRALSRLTGHPPEDALGLPVDALAAPGGARRLAALLDRSFEGEPASGFELRLGVGGGREACVVASSFPIYGASGRVEGVMLIGQDQTLLRAFEAQAEHAQKLAEVGRLAAGIVHEINNPLTAVTAYADALISKLSLAGHEPADVEKLRRILEAGERIQRFSRDLLAYARPSQDGMQRVELEAVLSQAVQMCEPALKSAGARVERRLSPAPPVRGVRASLIQVFVNLLTNAAHALGPEGGTVSLALEPAGGHVAVQVQDDGQGMPLEVQRRAFEPFFTTKPHGEGSGLGLSIVQGIVARHGGSISMESEPGVGTTFTVVLPVWAERGDD